jgi:H+/Cl- antiporter ClcA
MDFMQILIWALIGLIYAGYGYLTNKLGDWSTEFQKMRLGITVVIGACVGLILGYMGVELTPETLILYLQMPLFAGMGVLYLVERLVKALMLRFTTQTKLAKLAP